jgi:FKBP-type peptidyl-prolyl cis-trans isomerase FkpA
MPKQSLREQRRIAREERRRRQRMIFSLVVVVVVVAAGLIAFRSIQVSNQNKAIAAATGTAQVSTSTAAAATQAAIPTPQGMQFPGVITDTVKTASGLQYKDLVIGNGQVAATGNTVSVQYTGWLTDGTKFDSSLDQGQALEFPLGRGGVIKGWDEGVAGMKVGGTRILIIPPDLGYGTSGSGLIPADATLVFEVQLVAIK